MLALAAILKLLVPINTEPVLADQARTKSRMAHINNRPRGRGALQPHVLRFYPCLPLQRLVSFHDRSLTTTRYVAFSLEGDTLAPAWITPIVRAHSERLLPAGQLSVTNTAESQSACN